MEVAGDLRRIAFVAFMDFCQTVKCSLKIVKASIGLVQEFVCTCSDYLECTNIVAYVPK